MLTENEVLNQIKEAVNDQCRTFKFEPYANFEEAQKEFNRIVNERYRSVVIDIELPGDNNE